MNKTIYLLALALLLLLASCDTFQSAGPAADDPNVGGGLAEPFAEEAGGGQIPPAGGAPSAPVEPETGSAPAGTPEGELVVLPELHPGDVYQHGELTFTLEQVRAESDRLVIHYSVSGLASDYTPVRSSPLVQLANGTRLEPTGGSGGGKPPVETHRYTFPALPPGTVKFTLLLGNSWSGELEFWQIPVAFRKLQ